MRRGFSPCSHAILPHSAQRIRYGLHEPDLVKETINPFGCFYVYYVYVPVTMPNRFVASEFDN
jgi:hypothetical protein